MPESELIPRLFRTEFSKIASVLCKYLGVDNLEIAEDIASETFLSALETWPYKGVPENPEAWLYTVAKNKTRNFIKRNKIYTDTIIPAIQNSSSEINSREIDLSGNNIYDSQLQMLFAICHELPSESEINNRLDTVLTTLYLLFNEGYYSESQDTIIREDLCLEVFIPHDLKQERTTAENWFYMMNRMRLSGIKN